MKKRPLLALTAMFFAAASAGAAEISMRSLLDDMTLFRSLVIGGPDDESAR
jgi:hypothetical protein